MVNDESSLCSRPDQTNNSDPGKRHNTQLEKNVQLKYVAARKTTTLAPAQAQKLIEERNTKLPTPLAKPSQWFEDSKAA